MPAATPYYVSTNGKDDTNNGLTWATAFETVGHAVTQAAGAGGGEIEVGAGTFGITSTLAISTAGIVVRGQGYQNTTLQHQIPGTENLGNSAPTLASATTLPANGQSTTITVNDPLTLLPSSGAVFIGSGTDGLSYPFAYLQVSAYSGSQLTGTVQSGGNASYVSGAVVVKHANTITVSAANVTLERLTIDGSPALAGSGVYALEVGSSAPSFIGQRLQVLGQANYSLGVGYDGAIVFGPQGIWRDNIGGVRFYGTSAVDGLCEGNFVSITTGQPFGFTAEQGAHRCRIVGNRYINTSNANSFSSAVKVAGIGSTLAGTPVTLPASTLTLASTSGFATGGGTAVVGAPSPANTAQVVSYTGVSGNQLTGVSGGSGTFPAGSTVAQMIEDIVVAGNYAWQAQVGGVYATWASGLSVRGNTMLRSGLARQDGGQTITGIQAIACIDSEIGPGNLCDTQGGYGIACANTPPTGGVGGPQPYLGGRDCRVFGNRVRNCGDPGITVQAINDVAVVDNDVIGASFGFSVGEGNPWGFTAQSPCRRVRVERNRFAGCDWGGGYVQSSSDCLVRANEFHNCGFNTARADDRAHVFVYDGFNAGVLPSVGNRIEDNWATRSGLGIATDTVATGTTIPSAATLAYSLPHRFVRDAAPSSGFTTLTQAASQGDTTLYVADLTQLPAAPGTAYLLYTSGGPVTVTYTGKSAPSGAGSLTGVSGLTISPVMGAVIGSTFFPTLATGYNVIRNNRYAAIARGLAPSGGTISGASVGPDLLQGTDDTFEPSGWTGFGPAQVLSNLDTIKNSSGTGAVVVTDSEHFAGSQSTSLTAAAGQIADAGFDTTSFDYSTLPDDAFFEVGVKIVDATSMSGIRFSFGLNPSYFTNYLETGTVPPALLEAAGTWLRFRFRRGDMRSIGTVGWGTNLDFHVRLTATAGGTTQVKVNELRVIRAG